MTYSVPPSHISTYTQQLAQEGVSLLTFRRLAATESDHVAEMLRIMDVPYGGHVCDMGSGTGEFPRLAALHRPDIQFTVVNDDEWQLSQSPESCTPVLADMTRTPLPDASFDVVLLAYAVGHCDVIAAVREAHRLLVPGGKLIVHDQFARDHGKQAEFLEALHYSLHMLPEWGVWADLLGFTSSGFKQDDFIAPGTIVDSVVTSGLLDNLDHGVLTLTKTHAPKLSGGRTALQFSGGKDSLACLYLLRPFLPEITVYHLDTGDQVPETVALVSQVRGMAPDFRVIPSDVVSWRNANGYPSDLVPAKAHWIGVAHGLNAFALTNRFDCCWANLMLPMHNRMAEDGVQTLIRGTKLCDTGKVPHEGDSGVYNVVLPIKNWSHEQVFSYLAAVGAPKNAIYEHYKNISAPECLGCTAWWDDGKAAYLRDKHPDKYIEYRANLSAIVQAVTSHMADLYGELKE